MIVAAHHIEQLSMADHSDDGTATILPPEILTLVEALELGRRVPTEYDTLFFAAQRLVIYSLFCKELICILLCIRPCLGMQTTIS